MLNTPSTSVGAISETPQAAPPEVSTRSRSILLLRPPYFTPWTPPLGIGILKTFLNSRGHRAKCFDFNADPELWGMHHRYFSTLAATGGGTHDGYSKLWWIINAHMLAYANGASPAAQRRVIDAVSPLYGVHVGRAAMETLLGLIDRYFTRLSHIFDQVDLAGYDFIGTSTYTTSLSSSLWVLQRAKRRVPGITTVMGGGVFADDLATGSENLQILLDQYPLIDHVVMGEGELLLLRLLDGELSHKRTLVLGDLGGKTLAMGDVPTPDFSDFDMSRYYNLTIEGARSCPFQCSFCSETIQWGEYRRKPIDKFVHQVREMADRMQVRELFLGDSLMNPYLIPFADTLIAQDANIIYDGYLRADKPVTKANFVEKWAESGLYRVRLGIESGSDSVLTAMHKMTTTTVIAEVLKTLSRAGIRTTTYWIVGHPGETEEHFEETCAFIRANHRYIYELEAHPYYYYPYGQVGSRLYECESTYPDEVVSQTKFKVWEIIGGEPSREVRYQRLERISALAAELGLPNIYTMTDRYDAEARWRALHPYAREVFRDADAVAQEAPHVSEDLLRGLQAESDVIAYRVSAAKRVDADLLTRALAEVSAHYPLLRAAAMTTVDASGASDDAASDGRTVGGAVATDVAIEAAIEPAIEGAIEAASDSLRRDASVPLRVLLVRQGGDEASAPAAANPSPEDGSVVAKPEPAGDAIVLLARRLAVDAASVITIAEALCRVYEQLAAGKATYVRPEEKPYGEYWRGQSGAWEPSAPATRSDAGVVQHTLRTVLGPPAAAALSPAAGRRRESHLYCLTAALRVLARLGMRDVGVLVDPRIIDSSLAHTVGPVSQIVSWVDRESLHGEPADALDAVRMQLEKLVAGGHAHRGAGRASRWQAVIDLDYLVEPAWMGRPGWQVAGWVSDSQATAASGDGAALRVRPRATGADVAVEVTMDDAPEARAAAREFMRQFEAEIVLLASEDDGLRRAERYWHEELGHEGPGDRAAEAEAGTAGATGPFESVEIDLPTASGDLRAALVAAYALLAPRLDHLPRPLVGLLHTAGRRVDIVPLRIHESGNPACVDVFRLAGEKIALARALSGRAEAVQRKRPLVRFAAHGCLMNHRDDPAVAESFEGLECHTILDIADEQRPPRLLARRAMYRRADVESLAAALASIVTRALLDPTLRLREAVWDSVQRADPAEPIEIGELGHDFLLDSELS